MNISVVLTTYNRAEALNITLRAMSDLDNKNLNVDFFVVDNNSSDNTKDIVSQYVDKINITYLFEAKQGKNCALNQVLDNHKLGEIVVFTDDDVSPSRNWLQEIASACQRHPGYDIFGGKVTPQFPISKVPDWVNNGLISIVMFAKHDEGPAEKDYNNVGCPVGPNFWVRRRVIDAGYRYNEFFGPRPKNRLMGSETTFIKNLISNGYKCMWIPTASLEHRIEPEALNPENIIIRAKRYGRSKAYHDKIFNGDSYNVLRQFTTSWKHLQSGYLSYIVNTLNIFAAKRFTQQVWCAQKIARGIMGLKLLTMNHKTINNTISETPEN